MKSFAHLRLFIAAIPPITLLLALDSPVLASENEALIHSSFQDESREIHITPLNGRPVTRLIAHTLADGYPVRSPSGDKIAFYGKYDDYKTWSILVADSDGNNIQRLTHRTNVWDAAPSWSPDGKYLLFSRSYKPDDGNRRQEIWLMQPDGSAQTRIANIAGSGASFTPDGQVLYHSASNNPNIAIAERNGGNVRILTDTDAQDWHPEMSPDGRKIAFMSNRDGNREIYVMNADGTEQTRLTNNEISDWDPVWSADSTQIAFVSDNAFGLYDIYIINADGTNLRRIVENGSQPSWFYP